MAHPRMMLRHGAYDPAAASAFCPTFLCLDVQNAPYGSDCKQALQRMDLSVWHIRLARKKIPQMLCPTRDGTCFSGSHVLLVCQRQHLTMHPFVKPELKSAKRALHPN